MTAFRIDTRINADGAIEVRVDATQAITEIRRARKLIEGAIRDLREAQEIFERYGIDIKGAPDFKLAEVEP